MPARVFLVSAKEVEPNGSEFRRFPASRFLRGFEAAHEVVVPGRAYSWRAEGLDAEDQVIAPCPWTAFRIAR